MADTIEDVINYTFNEDELDTGSVTLKTVEANTAYVIKEIYAFRDSLDFSSAKRAERAVVGKDANLIIKNAGSEIATLNPENPLEQKAFGNEYLTSGTTVTLETERTYPIEYYRFRIDHLNGASSLRSQTSDSEVLDSVYYDIPTTTAGTSAIDSTIDGGSGSAGTAGYISLTHQFQDGSFILSNYDTTTAFELYYWSAFDATRETIASTTTYQKGVIDVENDTFYFTDGSSLKSITSGSGATAVVNTITSSLPNSTWGGFPRLAISKGFLFYTQNNEGTSVYVYDIANNKSHTITSINIVNAGNVWNLYAGYDESSDKIWIGRKTNATGWSINEALLSPTLTEMLALTDGSTITAGQEYSGSVSVLNSTNTGLSNTGANDFSYTHLTASPFETSYYYFVPDNDRDSIEIVDNFSTDSLSVVVADIGATVSTQLNSPTVSVEKPTLAERNSYNYPSQGGTITAKGIKVTQ